MSIAKHAHADPADRPPRAPRQTLRVEALGGLRVLAGIQVLSVTAVITVGLLRAQLPDEILVLLVGKRRIGEGAMSTDTALFIAASASVGSAFAFVWLFVWLTRSTAVLVSARVVEASLTVTALETPVVMGLMMTSLTGWSAWPITTFVAMIVMSLLLEWRRRAADRRWLLTAPLDEIARENSGDPELTTTPPLGAASDPRPAQRRKIARATIHTATSAAMATPTTRPGLSRYLART